MVTPDAVEAVATTDGSRMEAPCRSGVSRGKPTWVLRLGDGDEEGQG
jgi:hypothetical protein